MTVSKPRRAASAAAASTSGDAKANPKSATGVEEPASQPEPTAPKGDVADTDEPKPEPTAPKGDASAKPAENSAPAPADTGDAKPAPQVPDTKPDADTQPVVDYKALAEAARAELDSLKAKLATQESLKAAGLAPDLADYVILNSPEDAQKLAAIIAPQNQAAPFAPVGDDDNADENITTIGSRIFGRR